MIVYISSSKNSTRKLLQLKITSAMCLDLKLTQINQFLYTNDKQAEKEIREITLFTIARNNRKYFGVTQTKQVKDLYDIKRI